MSFTASITISGSVGIGGQNAQRDVRAVQGRLNELIPVPNSRLAVTGRFNEETQRSILEFQGSVLGQHPASGLIEPNSRTLAALNDEGSIQRWAESRPNHGPGIAIPASATPHEREVIGNLARASGGAGSDAMVVLNRLLESSAYGHFKNALNATGSGQWAGEFANAVRYLRSAGLSNEMISSLFLEAARMDLPFVRPRGAGGGFGRFMKLMADNPSLGPSVGRLSRLGTALNVIAVMLCAVEVVNHLRAGRFAPAVAEIYGVVMQIGVPWAGFVDGVQSVVYAYAPGVRGPAAIGFFRLLNAINPIGAGKTGVDAAVSIVETLCVSIYHGRLDLSRLDSSVDRMRNSPMSLFVEIGESLVDDLPRVNYRGVNPPAR